MKPYTTWIGILALVGSITTGWIFIDDRFAHSADVHAQFADIERQFSRQEMRELERDIFALQQAALVRKLSQLELERLAKLLMERERLAREWSRKGW